MLVLKSLVASILLSLQSLNRYQTKNTVVTIKRDFHYWNISLPSFTICPMIDRIDKRLFDACYDQNGIIGIEKTEFYEFIESMANATYESFHQIKDYESIEVRMKKRH